MLLRHIAPSTEGILYPATSHGVLGRVLGADMHLIGSPGQRAEAGSLLQNEILADVRVGSDSAVPPPLEPGQLRLKVRTVCGRSEGGLFVPIADSCIAAK